MLWSREHCSNSKWIFLLKKIIQLNKKQFFLSPLIVAINIHNGYKHNNSFSQTSLNSSIIKIQNQKHNLKINQFMTIKAKKKKKKKTQVIWPIWATLGRKTSGGGVEGAAWHSERWFFTDLCPSINGGASKISRLFFLSLPLSPFLITKRARGCFGIK